jgi:predicted transcriptional regulator
VYEELLRIDALTHYVQRKSWQVGDIHEGVAQADTGKFAAEHQVKAVFAKYGV